MWPTSSKVRLSLEPWKRSVRTVSASASSFVVTAPPSPNAPRFLDGKNEKVASVPSAPVRRPSARRVPADCAASSITGTPSASISAIGATLPNRWTAITALVFGVITARTRLRRSARRSRGRCRRRPGVAPSSAIGSAEAKNVNDGTMTSSPGPTPERAQREQQRVGAVGHADRVLGADVGRELALERRRPPARR